MKYVGCGCFYMFFVVVAFASPLSLPVVCGCGRGEMCSETHTSLRCSFSRECLCVCIHHIVYVSTVKRIVHQSFCCCRTHISNIANDVLRFSNARSQNFLLNEEHQFAKTNQTKVKYEFMVGSYYLYVCYDPFSLALSLSSRFIVLNE